MGALAMTFGDQAKRLVSLIRNLTTDEARKLINRAYLHVSTEHGWRHRLKRWTLQTDSSYATGTVAVTNGSTAIALTDGTWDTSWTTSPSMRRINIAGRMEPYDLTITGAATGTLADPWAGTDNATANYLLYRDTYPLPSDCGYTKVIGLYDPQLLYRLNNFHQMKFLEVRSSAPWLVTIPECFTVVSMTSETPPRPQIQMYPAPGAQRVYHGWYFSRPDFATSDGQYLDWPQDFDDMIWTRAVVDHYRQPQWYSPKFLNEYKPMYADLWNRMKSAMDGESSIDNQIEEARLGAGYGGGSGWNPDPTGLSGGGSMNW